MTNDEIKALRELLRRVPSPDTVIVKAIGLCDLTLEARADATFLLNCIDRLLKPLDGSATRERIESYRP